MTSRFGRLFTRVKERLAMPFAPGERGMSLIEIIIVVALLGTLMAYMASNLIGTSEEAKKDQARIAMGQIQNGLQMYRVHNNRYPTTDQGLDALITNPGNAKAWRGPYVTDNQLVDPWGERFSYESDGRTYKIISGGPDLQIGTEDDVVYPEASTTAGGG